MEMRAVRGHPPHPVFLEVHKMSIHGSSETRWGVSTCPAWELRLHVHLVVYFKLSQSRRTTERSVSGASWRPSRPEAARSLVVGHRLLSPSCQGVLTTRKMTRPCG